MPRCDKLQAVYNSTGRSLLHTATTASGAVSFTWVEYNPASLCVHSLQGQVHLEGITNGL